jgi:DNA repair protein RecN (Recombination protein N)
MLKHLTIRNFALIDSLDMDFCPGFSVITGETGAGKSIILGAVSLLLGQRADSKALKQGAQKCTIEAQFDLSRYSMDDFFTANDIDYDAEDCILRRELTASGKSRSFINDTPVPLTLMRELGNRLMDIHSQHQNLMLQQEDFQMGVLDIIGNSAQVLADYQEAYGQYQTALETLERQQTEMERTQENEDFIRYQHKELADAMLTEGMQEELEQESEMLSHVEDIKNALYGAGQLLSGDEREGALSAVREALRQMEGIRDVYASAGELADRLESCHIELKDIADEINGLAGHVEYDPKRQEEIDDTLSRIYSLQKKHHVDTVEELLAIRDDLERQLNCIDNSTGALEEMEQKVRETKEVCEKKAGKLTEIRMKAARKVEKELMERLVPLGIPKVRFEVSMKQKALSADGRDVVQFLFSANTNTPLQPVSEVASGGEIARVMLSLKAMISGQVMLPTIIFDEIDTGVSGKIAEMMGKMIAEMGDSNRQVISITHLPQIAARGRVHYIVYKEESTSGTLSHMKMLAAEERVMEIAQMLSGSEVTEAAVANARELLGKS